MSDSEKIRAHPFSLEALLCGAARRMKEDLAERLVTQPGELGAGREEILRQFLSRYLPRRFEVSSGFAFDSRGGVSQQLDIVIFNSLSCPRFETLGGTRFFPCESILAVGQVKSSLQSRKGLRVALTNLESAKLLDRSASGRAVDEQSGNPLNPAQNHLDQIFTFLFVTGGCLEPDSLQDAFTEHILSVPAHTWTNLVLALDHALVTFCCDDGVCPNPMHARGVALQRPTDPDLLLARFYLLLGRALESTHVASLPYWEYLQNAHSWSPKVVYSATDDPPPFLASLPCVP